MTTDEGTPGEEALEQQSGKNASTAETATSEPPDTDALDKNLLRQAVIVGGIVLLVLLGALSGMF